MSTFLMNKDVSQNHMNELIGTLQEWAKIHPLIGRLWIFGSRARGDAHDESDLDIAVELNMLAIKGTDESGGFTTWSFDVEPLRFEVAALIGLKVDWQYYKPGKTRVIEAGVKADGILVYEACNG